MATQQEIIPELSSLVTLFKSIALIHVFNLLCGRSDRMCFSDACVDTDKTDHLFLYQMLNISELVLHKFAV